jgi:nucleotide-binding universal stress UspA family protein
LVPPDGAYRPSPADPAAKRLESQDRWEEAAMAIKPIIVGIDGSEPSLRAVDWAAREAVLRDVPLRIVSVCAIQPRANWVIPHGSGCGTLCETAGKALQEAGDRADTAAHGLTIDTSLLVGEPAAVLADAARNALMLVVGSAGVSGLGTSAFGSVTQRAAAHAPCTVVIHRGEAPVHYRIVVGIRDVDDSVAALGFAFDEASHRGAHLLAVQAWYGLHPAGAGGSAVTPKRVSSEAFVRLARLLEPWQEKYPEVEVGAEVIHARPRQALPEITASADLLVLGRHSGRLSGTDSPLGSATYAVLEHAYGPVALVPDSQAGR